MKQPLYKPSSRIGPLIIMILLFCFAAYGQKNIIINMAAIDGLDITPDNILNFQVQSGFPTNNATIKGVLHYRGSNMSLSYTFNYTLRDGMNVITGDMVQLQWQFSSPALRELFLTYKMLPEGTYEYCVTITPAAKVTADNPIGSTFDECLYHRSNSVFLINLLDPENNAKIKELNPSLSWTVNYPFANELTYRIRVAPIQQGQNPQNAVTRNNPVYDESNLMQQSIVYPIYAKPLEINQPYAWTVDAYFKGILLGGAEDWQFTVIQDSLMKAQPGETSYIELNIEHGKSIVNAPGQLKLKFTENQHRIDTLRFTLVDDKNNVIKLPTSQWPLERGDNRLVLHFADSVNLKHEENYRLSAVSQYGDSYQLNFKYLNPLFIGQ